MPYEGTLTYSNGASFQGRFKGSHKPYNGTLTTNASEKIKVKKGISFNGSKIIINGILIEKSLVIQKTSKFINWLQKEKNLLEDKQEKEYTINGKNELLLKMDSISLEYPKSFENIIIIKNSEQQYLIQDLDTHLEWFKKSSKFPLNRNCVAIFGSNYWTKNNLIEFIVLTNWSEENTVER